jgi:3-vinyl bacteriochlorophyllide hydratase
MQNTARGWSDLGAGPSSGRSRDFVAQFAGQQIRSMASKNSLLDQLIARLSNCPWPTTSGSYVPFHPAAAAMPATRRKPLYTSEERVRRDATPWTLVQGVLAPIQFLVFLVSVGLVLTYLRTGDYYAGATASVVVKTLVLYTIMVTGAIWEKRVFGKYLFAPAFFWEDAVSMIVIALHTAYLVAVIGDYGTARDRMIIALAAYATYAINATQFILKLRAARLGTEKPARAERAA